MLKKRLWSAQTRRNVQNDCAGMLCRSLQGRLRWIYAWALMVVLVVPASGQELLMREVISREMTVFVGESAPTNSYQEIISRDVSIFNGQAFGHEMPEAVSRQITIVNTTLEFPARVENPTITSSPTGEQVTLDWSYYNEFVENDVAFYAIYYSSNAFSDVSGMTVYTNIPGGQRSVTLEGLPAWQDHFFAIVPVDAQGGYHADINYSAAYVLGAELVSREISIFNGQGDFSQPEVISREITLVVGTDEPPVQVGKIPITASPTGDEVTLDWSSYNELAQDDIAYYAIYYSSTAFINVSGMTPYAQVMAENRSVTFTGLPAWQDHFFAVVPVDSLGNSFENVVYNGAYVLGGELISREISMFVGSAGHTNINREVISREIVMLVADDIVPDPVTGIDSGFTAATSIRAYQAVELEWPNYNELAQNDVASYRIYVSDAYFDDVSAMTPFKTVLANRLSYTLGGLDSGGIYHVAVVAEDIGGNYDPTVRSVSCQASVGGVSAVRNLAVEGGETSLTFSWNPPEEGVGFLDHYEVYFGGASEPEILPTIIDTYVATNLSRAHAYTFRIVAVDIFDIVNASSSATGVTWLYNPSNLVLTAIGGDIILDWEPSEPSQFVQRYELFRSSSEITDISGMIPIATSLVNSVTLGSLAEVENDWFAVAAVNVLGEVDPAVTSVQVFKVGQTITFDPVVPGPLQIPLSASASSGLPVSFSASPSQMAQITGSNTLSVIQGGTVRVTAFQGGDAAYWPAETSQVLRLPPVIQSFTADGTELYDGMILVRDALLQVDARDEDGIISTEFSYRTTGAGTWMSLGTGSSANLPVSILDSGNYDLKVEVSAGGSNTAERIHTLTLESAPVLSMTLGEDIFEGMVLTGTVSVQRARSEDLSVSIGSTLPMQIGAQSPVIIPAGQTFAVFSIEGLQDDLIEDDKIIQISALAPGSVPIGRTVTLIDDDWPNLYLNLSRTIVPESAGSDAVVARIEREPASSQPLTVWLTNSDPGSAVLPESIRLEAGEGYVDFPIGVLDDELTNGTRIVELRAEVRLEGIETIVQSDIQTLEVGDDEGPVLELRSDKHWIFEGETNALTVIRHGGDTNESTEIFFEVDVPADLYIAASVSLSSNTTEVTADMVGLDGTNGSRTVIITASAADYGPAQLTLLVTDEIKPDFTVSSLQAPTALESDEIFDVVYTLENQGSGPSTQPFVQRVFFSHDAVPGGDILLSQSAMVLPMEAGEHVILTNNVRAPQTAGDYWLFVISDAALNEPELIEWNNAGVYPQLITVGAPWLATVEVDEDLFAANTPVLLYGSAMREGGAKVPFAPVALHIRRGAVERVISTMTDASGDYELQWQPLLNEGGDYEVGACHPGTTNAPTQDSFSIISVESDFQQTSVILAEGETVALTGTVHNTTAHSLEGLWVEIPDAPAGLGVDVTLSSSSLPAGSMLETTVSLIASNGFSGTSSVTLRLHSGLGTVLDVPFHVDVRPLDSDLVIQPASLNASVVRGSSKIIAFDVQNHGGLETGTLNIILPQVSWIKPASSTQPASIPPGESETVSIVLQPDESQPLTLYSGHLVVVPENGSSRNLPFRFRVVSDERGHLKIEVTDEYTYYGADSPRVDGADVVVRDAVTAEEMGREVTGTNGLALFADLPEGWYTVEVDSPDHTRSVGNYYVDAGETNHETVFVSREFVTYTWRAEEVGIEDRYRIVVESTFEVNVPAPVITLEPASLDVSDLNELGATKVVNMRLVNHGFIAAEQGRLTFPDFNDYTVTPLIEDIGTIPAKSEIIIPVTLQRTAGGPAPQDEDLIAAAAGGSDCGGAGNFNYSFICGPISPGKNVSIPISGMDGCGGCCGWWGASGGGGGPGGGSINAASFGGATVNCTNPCLWKVPLDCFGGCPWELFKAHQSGKASDLASAALGCAGISIPLKGEIECIQNIIACLKGAGTGGPAPMAAPAENGDGPWLMLVDSETRMLSPAFAAALDRTETQLDFFEALYGTRERVLALDDPYMSEWDQQRILAMAPGSDEGEFISAQEMADLATYATILGLDPALTMPIAERMNRTLDYNARGMFSAADVPAGESLDFIDQDQIDAKIAAMDQAALESQALGYDDPLDELKDAYVDVVDNLQAESPGVCAEVRIQVEQRAVMTRSAFQASLELVNRQADVDLENVSFDFQVRDENGQPAGDRFNIQITHLSGVDAVDGSGIISAMTSGTAQWTLIPRDNAAPMHETVYTLGGTISYKNAGVALSIPVQPVSITVRPDAALYLKYYHQRDVISDDPHTDPVEAKEPFGLAVVVENRGAGTAHDLSIASAQPEIVDNEKGLLIDFEIIGSEIAGEPASASLTAEFGNIYAETSKTAVWWMTASLHGFFRDFEASFEHLDGFGDPRISLIKDVQIFEMVRMINALGDLDDGQPDFLTNEKLDFDDFPIADTLHLSDGSVADVGFLGAGATCSNVTAGNLVVDLSLTNGAQSGWTYLRFPDPGNGAFRLIDVIRSDSLPIPVGTNVWTTDRTFVGMGRKPVYENMLHLVDLDSTGDYTLRYEVVPLDTIAPTSSMSALPVSSTAFFPVSWVGVDDTALAAYDIMVSTNSGPWGTWLNHTTRTGSIFEGDFGDSYAFCSIAVDTSGNEENKAIAVEAQTTVSLVNQAPQLVLPASTNIAEGSTLEYQIFANDPDGPDESLRFLVAAERDGVVISTNGLIRWVTSELDGGSDNHIQITVLDSAVPQGITSAWMTVSVDEVNSAPVFDDVGNPVAEAEEPFMLSVRASDGDIPAQSLSYALGTDAPAGMGISSSSGIITWLPPTNLVGQSIPVAVIVTDSGAAPATATNIFSLSVIEKVPDTTAPLPVAGLAIEPDPGHSDSDRIISVQSFSVIGTLPEPGLRVEILEGTNLLASTTETGVLLEVPVAVNIAEGVVLNIQCTDESGNTTDNLLPLTIDIDAPTAALTIDGTMKDVSNYLHVAAARIVFSESVNIPDLMANGLIDMALRMSSSNETIAPLVDDLQWLSASNTLVWNVPTNTLETGEWILWVDGQFIEDVAGNRLEASVDHTELGMPVYGDPEELVATYGYAVPVWHDVDGNGLGDLLVGEKNTNSQGQIRIYLNEGAPTNPDLVYSELLEVDGGPLTVPASGCLGLGFRLADLTGNGLEDLVVGRADGTVWLYETASIISNDWNIGPGAEIWSGASSRAALDVYDLDADGTNEVIVGGMDGLFRSVALDGTASVIGPPPTVEAGRSAPVLTDLNGDEIPELISGDSNGDVWCFFNVGISNDWKTVAWPLVDTPETWSRSRPFVADVNADHVPDLLLGTADGRVRLFTGSAPRNPMLAFAMAEPEASYTLTATSGQGGRLDPEGDVTVYESENQSFLVVPDAYWHTVDVFANGTSLGAVGSYTFSNVVENGQIHATFAQNMVTNAPVEVPEAWLAGYGWTNNFEVANTNDFDGDGFAAWEEYVAGTSPVDPASHFRIVEFRQSGSEMEIVWSPSVAGRRYSIMHAGTPGGVFANMVQTLDGPADRAVIPVADTSGMYRVMVELSEAPPQWLVMAFAGANGSVSPSGLQYASPGSNTFHFVMTPDEWYHVLDVRTNGISLGAVEALTLSNVTDNVGLQVEFAENMVVSAPVAVPERYLAGYGWTENVDTVVFSDSDGDGFAVWQEYVTGSSPTNPISFFRITRIWEEEGNVAVRWSPSIEDRLFTLLRADTPAGPFNEVMATITGPADTLLVPAAQATGIFCVEVELSSAPPVWSVYATSDSHGSISPSGLIYVSPGSNTLDFSIMPDSWYHITDVTVNGVSTGAVHNLTLDTIGANVSVHAFFTENIVTNAPVDVPEYWLAAYGLSNNFESVVTEDTDVDGYLNWEEFLYLTDPTNAASYFMITTNQISDEILYLAWEPSSERRTYTPVLEPVAGTNIPLPTVYGPLNSSTNDVGSFTGSVRIDVDFR